MPTNDQRLAHPLQKLLIVRLGSMGDVIHALPAVAALRQVFPETRIGWAIERRWTELLFAPASALAGPLSIERPLVHDVHIVNTLEWRSRIFSPLTWREVRHCKRSMRAQEYAAVIDFQGALKSAVIARWANSPKIYGFASPREKIARNFYSDRVQVAGAHIIEQNLSLAEFVAGQRLQLAPSLLPRDQTADLKVDRWLMEHKISSFALINPGAGWGAKQWPAERYGLVAKELASQGLSCVVNYGPGEEEIAQTVAEGSGKTALPLCCTISELIALVRRTRIFIGGDTGPMHLAAAVSVPVVAIFGPTDPARNGPYETQHVVVRSPASATSYSHHKDVDEGLMKISVDEVREATLHLLGNKP